MTADAVPPILLASFSDDVIADWVAAIGDVAAVPVSPDRLPDDVAAFSAVVLDGRDGPIALDVCRRLGLRTIDARPLLLYVAPNAEASTRLTGFTAGADAVVPADASASEFAAQVRVFERWQKARGQWLARATDSQLVNKQLQQAYQQIDLDLRLARQLQASFLPRSLPAVGPIRFAVSYRPCGQVGGDFYDVFRLDEQHVGFYVADAMGHGLPASLLTIFLKKAVQAKEVTGSTYRLVPPSEVMARLNRDLIAQGLPELPFITMVYGLLNCRDGVLQFARAAHPHPVYIPRAGPPELWQTTGTLLGVFEAEYPPTTRTLGPGDKFVVYTDGVPATGPAHAPEGLFAAVVEHRAFAVEAFVDRVSQQLLSGERQPDDFTLLGLEMLPA